MKLYVAINGKKQGPFSVEEVAEKFGSGQVKATDLAWQSGMSDWEPVVEVCPELAAGAENESASGSNQIDTLQPDATFGKHRIVRLLGSGGMGEVYEVEHELTGQRHALKVLSSEVMEQGGALERFRKEAQVMARMEHAGIVKVDLAGEDEGRYWLRMELMKGREVDGQRVITLEEYFSAKGGRLPEAEVKALVEKILLPLGHAHDSGLVHRDLKPANVLFDGENVKIADFGLVNAAGADWMDTQVRSTVISPDEEDTLIDTGGSGSRSRALMGTYAYMSPEQKDGLPADARSDLYSLGLITFQMLTGLKSPGMKRPSELGLNLNAGWDTWLIKSLEEARNDRFSSAGEMQAALAFPSVSRSFAPKSTRIRKGMLGFGVSPKRKPKPKAKLKPKPKAKRKPKVYSIGNKRKKASPSASVAGSRVVSSAKPKAQFPVSLLWVGVLGLAVFFLLAWPFSIAPRIPPTSGEAFAVPEIELEMLWCAPGTFTMGSPLSEADRSSNETQHAVTLTQGFWLGKYEVTQAQWEAIMGTNPSEFKGSSRPVEMVSWNDATSFCSKLTELERQAGRLPEGYAYQLPTEAQWEYACRAGTKTAYSFGHTITTKQANYSGMKTKHTGSYHANPWGFNDMHGNVWEWCWNWYDAYPSPSERNPMGPPLASDRVLRGGSWDNEASSLRAAIRSGRAPFRLYNSLGFRVSLRPVQGKAE